MREVFKELIWDRKLGSVVAVIGFLDLAYSLYLLVTPDIAPLKTGHIDNRVWYGLGFAFLVYVAVLALRGAAKYKKRLEGEDNIRIVYNERRYSTCREIQYDAETIRVGYRVIGKTPIDNPVVFPSHLFRIDKTGKSTKIPITSIPLAPLVPTHQVHSGMSIMHWVSVFSHEIFGHGVGYKSGSRVISLLYENYPAKQITLDVGQYKLHLVARGTSSSSNVGTFTINVDEDYLLNIAFEGIDEWSIR